MPRCTRGAIPAMLATLDPHSTFLSPEEFLQMREQERGSYAGVGVQIDSFGDKAVIDFPFPGTPAFEAGILPGDTIELVDGEPVEGQDLLTVREPNQGATRNNCTAEPFAGGCGRMDRGGRSAERDTAVDGAGPDAVQGRQRAICV